MAARRFSDADIFAILDFIHSRTGKVPSQKQARAICYVGGGAEFNSARAEWARLRGITMKPSARYGDEYMPTDIQAEAEAVRAENKIPKPETERPRGRPFRKPVDQMTPAEQAIEQYRKSWRRIREVRA